MWAPETIDDLVADCRVMTDNHSLGCAADTVVPIFVYTAELHDRVQWAVWRTRRSRSSQNEAWHVSTSSDLEHEWKQNEFGRFRLCERRMRALGIGPHTYFEPTVLDSAPPSGLSPYFAPTSSGNPVHVVRYVNRSRGTDDSPLSDSGLWLPQPDDAFGEGSPYAVNKIPTSGVLEYLLARGSNERICRKGWSSEPAMLHGIQDLVNMCEAKKNQQKYDHELWLHVAGIVMRGASLPVKNFEESCCSRLGRSDISYSRLGSDLAMSLGAENMETIRRVFDAKTPVKDGKSRPTPLEMAHGLTMQRVSWKGQVFIAALSASPGETRMICSVLCEHVCKLYQMNKRAPHQPFFHINHSMRAFQFNRIAPSVSVQRSNVGGMENNGLYTAAGDWESRVRDHVEFRRERDKPGSPKSRTPCALWNGHKFEMCDELMEPLGCAVAPEKALITLNTWFLPALRPLIQLLDQALAKLASTCFTPPAPPVLGGPSAGVRKSLSVNAPGWRRRSSIQCSAGEPLVFPPAHEFGRVAGKNYRGISNVELPREVYSEGRVVRWAAFTSASEDQGIATSFATDEGASTVFTLQGFSCLRISPFSRFARERECLYLPNSLFQIVHSLTQEQQQILGREGLQLYELREVSEQEATCIMVHGFLKRVRSKGAAVVVLQAEEAIRGDGQLDLSLASPADGAVAPGWRFMIRVPEDVDCTRAPPASTDWEQVKDPLAMARLYRTVQDLPPVPRTLEVTNVPRTGADTSSHDRYRKGVHAGMSDYIVEARLRRRGDEGQRLGPRRVPCSGGAQGSRLVHAIGRALGWVSWRMSPDSEEHLFSTCETAAKRGSISSGENSVAPDTTVAVPEFDTFADDSRLEPTIMGSMSLSGSTASRKRAATRKVKGRPGRGLQLHIVQDGGTFDSSGGWLPERADKEPFYEVRLHNEGLVGGLVMKGHAAELAWIETFKLQYSLDCKTYTDVQRGHIFTGNSNNETAVTVPLAVPVYARAIRIVPLTHSGCGPGLRVSLLCEYWGDHSLGHAFLYGAREKDLAAGLTKCVLIHVHGLASMRTGTNSPLRRKSMRSVSYQSPDSGSPWRRRDEVLGMGGSTSTNFQRRPVTPDEAAPEHWACSVELRYRSGRPGMAIGLEGADVLASVLRLGSPLRQLSLRNNRIGALGLALLLEALRSNKHVTQVDLDMKGGGDVRQSPCEGVHRAGTISSPGPETLHDFEDGLLGRQTTVDTGRVLSSAPFDPDSETDWDARGLEEGPRGWGLIGDLLGPDTDGAYSSVRAAIAMRCMKNRGQLVASQIAAFGSGWPRVAAEALWDLPDVLSLLPLKNLAHGHPERVVELLLHLSLQCRMHRAPMPLHSVHVAARFGSVDFTRGFLLELSQDPAVLDAQGCNALHHACRHLAFDVPESNALADTVNAIIKTMASTPSVLEARDAGKGWTPLWYAVYFYRRHTVQRLLQLGADVCASDRRQCTPLRWAMSQGCGDLVRELMKSPTAKGASATGAAPSCGIERVVGAASDLHVEHVAARLVYICIRRLMVGLKLKDVRTGPAPTRRASERERMATALEQAQRSGDVLIRMWLTVLRRRRSPSRVAPQTTV
eukprot:TRINITY_DN16499_c0_g2_i1.p1 TRINITY_DN16499_c0_g2~~TRINITY_DN16499_c0_g2_i1.p1  ORF type:complete len:1592 (+),score=332.96 TRINITY_DN16499_c0_g2_i1:1285-6060(+)